MIFHDLKTKLSAISSARTKGYSRLMGEDEEGTVRTVHAYKEVIRNFVGQHRGKVVDAPGDDLLAEFAGARRIGMKVQTAAEVRMFLSTQILPFIQTLNETQGGGHQPYEQHRLL